MIKLKQILSEMTDAEIRRIGKKIEAQDFRYVGAGDNARVYKFNNEDLVFKLTTSTDEIEIVDDELRINISEPGEYVIKLDSLNINESLNIKAFKNLAF